MRKLLILGMAWWIGFVSIGCSEEEVEYYVPENSALNFSSLEYTYSFAKDAEKKDAVLQIPILVVGPVADYPREVKVAVVTDQIQCVQKGDYSLAACVVPAGASETNLSLTLKYNSALIDTTSVLRLYLDANEHFGTGVAALDTVTISWTDQLIRPHQTTIWRSWWFWFSKTYSRSFHEVLLTALGDDVENISYYAIQPAVAAEHPEFMRERTPTYWYAVNRKLREYVNSYDKAHPDKPLRHGEDAQTYRTYNMTVGTGTPNPGATIASTLIAY